MHDHAPSPARLATVADALERIELALAGSEAAELRDRTHRLVAEYLLPRVSNPDDDLVVAVVGVSGAGKSTLVNSLARRRISDAGTRRPTTEVPIAWGHAGLPATLDPLRRRLPGRMVDALRPPPSGLAVVDTPPPDVASAEARAFCHDVIDVADVCIVVTAANRYADAAGFDLARRAYDRGLETIFVLNRLPATPELQRALLGDFAAKLATAGLIPDPSADRVIAIAEGVVSAERHGLSSEAVIGLRKELERIAEPVERARVADAAVRATAGAVETALASLRAALVMAAARRAELADPVRLAYAAAGSQVVGAVHSGVFSELRDDPEALGAALGSATARRAGRAALGSSGRWQTLGAHPRVDLHTHGGDTPATARDRFDWWEAELPKVAAELSGRRVGSRRAARLIAATRAVVFDPGYAPSRRERRLLRRYPGLAEAAAERLADEVEGILATDASRFVAGLGPPLPGGILGELSLEEAP